MLQAVQRIVLGRETTRSKSPLCIMGREETSPCSTALNMGEVCLVRTTVFTFSFQKVFYVCVLK